MIKSIPLLLSVPWVQLLSSINISNQFILFGIYYGFLTTLPIGPSQIITVRAFLLEGNLSGIIAVSGLSLGQFIIFLSVYYSPFYILLVKPHAITLLILPYLLFYWYKIKDLLDYQSLRPLKSLNDKRFYKLFFDSFFFQLLNPILLPSPVFARLINLFLFRYSTNFTFVFSCFFGWLCGQVLFINLCKFLLFRIESDSPILYLLVKRIIYRIFSIFFLSLSLLYLGKTPMIFFPKKINENVSFNILKSDDAIVLTQKWPTFFFDHKRWIRPFRFVENSRFSNQSPIKKKVSQFFFNICSSDGKQRIVFTYLPNLAIFEKDLNYSIIPLLSNTLYKTWIEKKKKIYVNLYNEFFYRIKTLNNEFSVEEILEKKTGLFLIDGNFFTKFSDPLLNKTFHEKMKFLKSPLLITKNSYKLKKNIKYFSKNNKLKHFLSNQWQISNNKTLLLPWEPLTYEACRILNFIINKSKTISFEKKLKKSVFLDENEIKNINKKNKVSEQIQNIADKKFYHKKIKKKSSLNWELILNLSTRQKKLYFQYLERERINTIYNLLNKKIKFNIFSNLNILFNKIFKFEKILNIQEMNKEIPRWTSNLKNDKFDVIAIGVTDIRQRKVKNLGYLVKGKEKRKKIVRRFLQQSDFRRKLIKGSMRARRRKTLIWKIFQFKNHSPFFLRITEKTKHLEFFFTGFKQKDFYKKNKSNFIKKTKADRLAIANRWDFPLAQWGRSWLLIIQSNLRKYVTLPTLIIVKNVIRLILFQNPEWNEDWYEWNKEIHIKCTYDGTEVSEKELPEQWLRDGLQIKIIYPFYLKPWHNSKTKKNNFIINENIKKNQLYAKVAKNKMNYCYLTAWGFQTKLPFGNIKKYSSFWKKIENNLKLKKYSHTISFFFNFFEKKLKSIFFIDLKNEKNKSNKDYSEKIFKYEKNSNIDYISKMSINESFFRVPIKNEYKTKIYVKELENILKNKNETIKKHKKKYIFITKLKIIQKVMNIHKKSKQSIKKLLMNFFILLKKLEINVKIITKLFQKKYIL